MMNYACKIVAAVLFTFGIAAAQPQVSYVIPDIGAPDMNIYVEIIGPYNSEQNFGTDGFYLNNPGDNVRVRCQNSADESKIAIGPVVVSWNGKMISTQVFVNPAVNPNSPDWTLLNNQFKIPLVVELNGTVSNTVTFYIVKPWSLGANGDVSALSDRTFGAGNLGKRSPRGAMIVDSLIMANDNTYHVSIADQDPVSTGNQGYMPFILISKGKLTGGTNTKILAKGAASDPNRFDAGPGGGGGGGTWCDLSGSSTRGGNGFTGGGPGGVNGSGLFSNSRQNPGEGSGSPSTAADGDGKIVEGGAALNGTPGGNSTIAYEAAGGGTGHPFGMSGSGCIDGNGCDPAGGYGAGSGRQQDQNGGAGGYATEGDNSSNNNDGKVVGNKMVVPLAGGSGGASGNPQDSNPIDGSCSGSGGAGGGAVMVSAMYITNLAVESNGIGGGGGSGNGDGGGGSGGFAGIQAKLALNSVSLIALGGNRGGGQGRLRFDYQTIGSYTTNPSSPVSMYTGIATDTTKWINKTFNLSGGHASGQTVRLFIKPESGLWQELPEPSYSGAAWSETITLPTTDTLFYIAAMQSVTNPKTDILIYKYELEPAYVMSQAAGNILHRLPKPIIAENDTTIKIKVKSCSGENVLDTAWVLNKGNAPLLLTYDDNSFTGGDRGFRLVAPILTTVTPKDSIPVLVRFSYQPGQTGTIRDTLLIQHNDTESDRIPWKIFLEAEIIKIDIEALTGNGTDTLDFGEICINSTDTMNYKAVNLSMDKVTFTAPDVITNKDKFTSWLTSGAEADPNDTVYYKVAFTAQEGTFGTMVYVRISDCPDITDSIYVTGTGVKAELTISGLPSDTIDLGDICSGDTKGFEFTVNNKSIVPVNINVGAETGQAVVSLAFAGTNPLESNDRGTVKVTATPVKEGPFLYKGYIYTTDCGGYRDTIFVKGKGVAGKLSFTPREVDFGEVKVGNSATQAVTLKNIGTGVVYIQQLNEPGLPFTVTGAVPQPPVFLNPGDSIQLTISYVPNNDQEHRDTLYANGLVTSGACAADTLLPLRGQGIKSLVELDTNLLDFGLIKNCHTKKDSVHIRNVGTASIDITAHQVTGTDNKYFKLLQSPTLAHTLKPGGSYTYIVEFDPGSSADGDKSAALEITTADNSVYVVTLKGSNEGLNVTIPSSLIFNSGPIGSPQQKVITAVNNGNFDAHLVKVVSSNPKVTVTPSQDVTIPAKGSTDFTVTMAMDVAGPVEAGLQFIFDSHCDDTLETKVSGVVLDGNLSYNSSIDYGIVAPCRDSVMTLTIANTGETPIELRTMAIQGTDAALFSFVTPFTPTTIAVDSTYSIDILFDPSNTSDGVKTAEVVFTAYYNSKENTYKTVLTGERRSGILSVPEPIVFGNIIIGKQSSKSVRVTNSGQQSIRITDIQFQHTEVYTLSPANPAVLLAPGEYADYVYTFSPVAEGCVYDTVLISFTFAGCSDTKPVPMNGCGINAGSITLYMPNLTEVMPNLLNYGIPITAVLSQDYKESTLTVNSAEIAVSFDANTFMPLAVSNGTMSAPDPVAGTRTVTIKITQPFAVSKSGTLVSSLTGNTMLGNTDQTPLTFVSATLLDTEGAPAAEVSTEDGSIIFKICRNGGDRLLSPSYPLKLSIRPNPVTDGAVVSVTALEKGVHRLEITGLQGELVYSRSWYADNSNGNDYTFDLDLSAMASGVYYLRVVSPTQSAFEPVFIIK